MKYTFQLKTDYATIPELYVRIDKEPDDEKTITTTYHLGDNDEEENAALYDTLSKMYFVNGNFERSVVGTGTLRCGKKKWTMTDMSPKSMDLFGPDDISIVWKFQQVELVDQVRVP